MMIKLWCIVILSQLVVARGNANQLYLNLPGDGPFEIRTQSPIQSLRYAAKIDDPRRKKAGYTSYSLRINAASIWANSPEYEMDYYTFDYQIEWEHHWRNGWKTELSLSQRNTNDARLDQLTINFHKLFGIDQNGRTEVPKHRYQYRFNALGIDEVDFKDQTFSQAIELLIAKNIYQDQKHSLSLGFTSHFETDERHRGWDFALRTDYYYSISQRHQLYGSLNYSRLHSGNFFNLPLKQQLVTLGISYEYQRVSNRSWLMQYLLNEGAAIGLGQLSEPSHEFLIGHRWTIDQHKFELAVTENSVNADNSADISFSLAYKYTPNQL